MLHAKRDRGMLVWGRFESCHKKETHVEFAEKIQVAGLIRESLSKVRLRFRWFRPPVVVTAMLMLVLAFAHSATAGRWEYICKNGKTEYSSKACDGTGGVERKQYVTICGDGILDDDEQCDNGASNSDFTPDGCRPDCRLAHCGDGVIDSGEQCDDGSGNVDNAPNTCRENCRLPFCGDGIVDNASHNATGAVFNEVCDDGNKDNSDGCMADCQPCLQLGQMGNIEVTQDTALCPAEYRMDDYGDYGAIIIKASGVTLDCQGAVLIGEGRGVGIVDFRSNNVTIKNCKIHGYDVGIRIQDARNVTLQSNYVCDNGQRDVELVDATDIHGYKPSPIGRTKCAAAQLQTPGNIPKAAMTPPSDTSKGKTTGRPTAVSKVSPKEHKTAIKTSPAGKPVVSTPPKRLAVHQGKPAAKQDTLFLYQEAERASWTSKSGKVVFGSDRLENIGMVRTLPRGQLANGSQAINLLVTQPDWKKEGYIQGVFSELALGKTPRLKATVAMLKGANPSDTLSFDVMIQEGRKITAVKKQALRGTQQVRLDVDLSRWRGKKVQPILRVRYLNGKKALPAVWINPIIENKP